MPTGHKSRRRPPTTADDRQNGRPTDRPTDRPKGTDVDTLLWIVIIAAIVVAGVWYMRQRNVTATRSL